VSFRNDADALLAQVDALRRQLREAEEKLAAAEEAVAAADNEQLRVRGAESALISELMTLRDENRRLRAEVSLLRAARDPAPGYAGSYLRPPEVELPEPEPASQPEPEPAPEPVTEIPSARIGSYLKPPGDQDRDR
jgi:hypothetical protein